MPVSRLAHLCLGAALLAMPLSAAAPASKEPFPQRKSVLVLLAHPDDELFIAPALAAEARGGAVVLIAYATNGDAGPGVSKLPKGAELAEVRSQEAHCANAALGLAYPMMLGFGDGRLDDEMRRNSLTGFLGTAFAVAKPDVVITWGPDGGYGHADHRLIGALATQLVQTMPAAQRPQLLYPGIRNGTLPPIPEMQVWATTAPELLSVEIAYNEQDLARASTAAQCHQTQFDADTRARMMGVFHQSIWQGAVHFRPAFGKAGR